MKKELFFIVFIVIGCNSCSTYRYIFSSSPPNNPYFSKKGESNLSAYYSTDDDSESPNQYANGSDLQAAYAIGNNWALTADYFNRKEKDIYGESYNMFDSSTVQYKRNLFGIGGGYFIPINDQKNITANLYAGLAKGKYSFHDDGIDDNGSIYNRYHESAINRWYIQPSINFMRGKYFRFAVIPKFSFVHYGKIKTNYTSNELEYFSLDKISNRTLMFFEPSLNMQFGLPRYPWIKIDGTVSGTTNYNDNDTRLAVRNSTSIGLTFDFSKMKKAQN